MKRTKQKQRLCPICGKPVKSKHFGRPKLYDRTACKLIAWRQRKAKAAGKIYIVRHARQKA